MPQSGATIREVGEAFTLLTGLPGEDVKPYHHRQIVLIPPQRWADWLDPRYSEPRFAGDRRPPGFLNVEAAPAA